MQVYYQILNGVTGYIIYPFSFNGYNWSSKVFADESVAGTPIRIDENSQDDNVNEDTQDNKYDDDG